SSLRDGGWNVKDLVRLIVTSAAFRQESAVTADLLARDPENRLYARGPRFRLDAEQIRDNALFVSGLINLETGGKGVKPYPPPSACVSHSAPSSRERQTPPRSRSSKTSSARTWRAIATIRRQRARSSRTANPNRRRISPRQSWRRTPWSPTRS